MASSQIIVSSVVTGIHRTKVGAHRDIPLLMENDNTIPDIDPNCIVVRFPEIQQIPERLHKAITYPKNPEHKRYEDQLVEDVAGRKVGNVPANICRLFRDLKRDGRVERLQWYVIFTITSITQSLNVFSFTIYEPMFWHGMKLPIRHFSPFVKPLTTLPETLSMKLKGGRNIMETLINT